MEELRKRVSNFTLFSGSDVGCYHQHHSAGTP
jgi:hypothetical protein